jgi:hypothetical protein
MANKILLVYILFNFLFAACGGLLLATVLVSRTAQQGTQTVSNVAQNLLMNHCPLIGKMSYPKSLRPLLTMSFWQPLESMPSSFLPLFSSPYQPWPQQPIARSSDSTVTPSSSVLYSQ